jgi:hypothetical protein
MEIDIVHHDAVVMILEMHFHRIADTYTDEWAGNLLIEGPVTVRCTVGELACDLDGFELEGRSERARSISGSSVFTILLTLCASGTGPFAGCAWYMRGLLGSSAADALLPKSRAAEHSSAKSGSNNAEVRTTATATPASAEPIPTSTRSFLLFGNLMAIPLSGSFRTQDKRSGPALFAAQQTRGGSTKCRRRPFTMRAHAR